MGCKDKISDRCPNKLNAVCVKYEGTLHADTELDTEDCHTLEEVIEDINVELDNINEQIDVSGLGNSCIDYTPSGEELVVKDVLLEFESQICELRDALNLDVDTSCPECIDPCNEVTGVCNNGLVKHTFATGNFPLTVVGTWKTGVTTTDQYSTNLNYSAPKDGIYKFTVEVASTGVSTSTGKVGIGVNTVDPIETVDSAGFFSSSIVSGDTYPKTLTFIKTLSKDDIAQVKVKLNSGTSFTILNIKLIVEKVA